MGRVGAKTFLRKTFWGGPSAFSRYRSTDGSFGAHLHKLLISNYLVEVGLFMMLSSQEFGFFEEIVIVGPEGAVI